MKIMLSILGGAVIIAAAIVYAGSRNNNSDAASESVPTVLPVEEPVVVEVVEEEMELEPTKQVTPPPQTSNAEEAAQIVEIIKDTAVKIAIYNNQAADTGIYIIDNYESSWEKMDTLQRLSELQSEMLGYNEAILNQAKSIEASGSVDVSYWMNIGIPNLVNKQKEFGTELLAISNAWIIN
jgi:hypothetical protein